MSVVLASIANGARVASRWNRTAGFSPSPQARFRAVYRMTLRRAQAPFAERRRVLRKALGNASNDGSAQDFAMRLKALMGFAQVAFLLEAA
ncbi:hypothetical protein [Arabiibacter massiliensis]|uniref:hypothetical protein n=1 Tax=Arabiibacter massiliensis TaxID=1870985 RepID=UPI00117ABB0A|nr:hypothetical protein [Arabiibacter massiliensis]